MPAQAPTSTVVSAPGKVLLAGGYLVLDRDYTGLVIGLDARMHVHIQPLLTSEGVSLSEIIVRSPQFRDAEWRYGYRVLEEQGGMGVTQLKGSSNASISRNVFVETALSYALTYITTVSSPNVEPAAMTILADEAYYSSSPASLQSNAQGSLNDKGFRDFNVSLAEAHKTGLGSSAALVVAFTAAVLSQFLSKEVFDLASDEGRYRLHSLAQIAHCTAQGKIGSGFDVAAAVYGSCLYRRFSPSVLEGLGEVGSAGFAGRLRAIVENKGIVPKWDHEILAQAVKVPKGIRLVMCDVDCGSQTVGMVKQVLAWRAANRAEVDELWGTLQECNHTLRLALISFHDYQQRSPEGYAADIESVVQGLSGETVGRLLDGNYAQLRDALAASRRMVQKMSSASNVPFEPPPQTKLLDACCALMGVLGGVVPGAGGYDAIALMVVDDERVLKRLNELLDNWKFEGMADAKEEHVGRVRPLGVREEMEGVQMENIEGRDYAAWLKRQ